MIRYLAVFVVVAFATGWAGDGKKVDLTVSDMHCDHCADKVKSALKKFQDVRDVQVSTKKGTARVFLVSTSVINTEVLAKAIADAGYGASYIEGAETKTLAATKGAHADGDCDKEGMSKMDCAKEGKMGCCEEKTSKTKALKKK